MQIETKFNVNQKVFCIEKERRIIKKPCNVCNDSETIKLKGKKYKCPECSGNGYGEYRNIYVSHKAVVSRIKISVAENGNTHITYRCIYDRVADLPLKEKHKETSIAEYKNRIFATQEEAEAACKELNNPIENH